MLLFLSLFAANIQIDPSTDNYNITPYTRYYLTDILQQNYLEVLEHDQEFKPVLKKRLLLGYIPDKVLWVRFDITNDSNETVEKYLEFDYPIQEQLYLYDIGGNMVYDRCHMFTPYFKLTFKPHESKFFLLQASNQNGSTILQLNLYTPKSYIQKNHIKEIATILFIGALGALFLYNLFLFIAIRDLSYLYYIVMMAGFAFIALYVNGFFIAYYDEFVLSKKIFYTILLILAVTMIFFTKTFLDLPKHFPRLDAVLDIIFVSLILLYGLNMFDVVPIYIQRVYYTLLFLFLIAMGIYVYTKGKKEALYYVCGWIILFLSIATLVLRQLGWTDIYDKFPYLTYVGVFTEAILFSMALSARINTLKEEKELASKKLLEKTSLEKERLEEYAMIKTQELQKALEEKETLLKELHHRVKNNLQIVISLLRLQADKYEDDELARALLESETRVRAISHVHEMLYKDDKLTSIDAQSYFDSLIQEIQQTFTKPNIKILAKTNCTIDMDKAIYCGLIVNELVTNALKYAFDEDTSGRIRVVLQQKFDHYFLLIEDNGKGFDPEEEHPESLGLKMVRALILHQLKGTLDIEVYHGTRFKIRFPY